MINRSWLKRASHTSTNYATNTAELAMNPVTLTFKPGAFGRRKPHSSHLLLIPIRLLVAGGAVVFERQELAQQADLGAVALRIGRRSMVMSKLIADMIP